MTEDEVREILRAATKKAGGLRAYGKAHAMSAAYLSDVIRGNRGVGLRVLSLLGLERVDAPPTYRKAKR